MNEQILKTLMANPEFKKAFKDMLLHNKDLAAELGLNEAVAKNVFVWCAEMTDANGGIFYHPIVAPNTAMMITSIDYMMNVNNYSMMASENQFEAYDKYEHTVTMFRSVYGRIPVKLIAVPQETYEKLSIALVTLVTSIIEEVNNCFDHLDRIALMANTKADVLKMQLLASVFGNMTTVASCFDQDMEIYDSSTHDYDVHEDEYDECDEEDDDEMWEDNEDDWSEY